MKKLHFTIALLFMFSLAGFSQNGPVGHLTIFSEDGDKFKLILNGELQNDIPQTNLRIEDLSQPYYNAKIQFEDKTLQDISKNNLAITDVDGTYQDVTYKIKRDKNNKSKMKMNFFSMTSIVQGYKVPSNIYVMHYGQPRSNGGYTQTNTTTTTSANQGMNMGVNMGGINMNVNINEPVGTTVTHTTTTTTQSNGGEHYQEYDNSSPSNCVNKVAMNNRDFNSAIETLKKESFDETKLKTAKVIAASNCLTVNQIITICKELDFEGNRLTFAKYAFDYCVEPKNYFKMNSAFDYSASQDELNDYIQGKK